MGALQNSTRNNHSSADLVLINVLSVTLEIRPKVLLCLVSVSLLSCQSLKCLNIHHLVNLEEVFRRLRDGNVKMNPKKCSFFKQRVGYLGHVVTPEGISPNPDKVRVVQEFPTPTNLKELRSFLGLVNYYRRFVRGFSNIAKPLNAFTKKNVPFVWTVACAEAFDKLKRALVSAPILACPNFRQPFLIYRFSQG